MGNDDWVEEETEKVCKVYDHDDFFTVFVQMLLAFFALMSLWFKRENEKPRRKFRTWFLDMSKQGLGACYAHVLNMAIAAVIINKIRGDGDLQDQCAWYGISYLIDTTLGLVLAIWGLKILDILARRFHWESLKKSGVYEGPEGTMHWISQVIAWLAILTVVKIIIYFFMIWCSEPLAYVGGILFTPLQGNIRFELLFVMIFFPGFLNVIYFWVADSYLQAHKDHAAAHEDDPAEVSMQEKKESLLSDKEAPATHSAPADPNHWTSLGDTKPPPSAGAGDDVVVV